MHPIPDWKSDLKPESVNTTGRREKIPAAFLFSGPESEPLSKKEPMK